jgi:hypothetical protein
MTLQPGGGFAVPIGAFYRVSIRAYYTNVNPSTTAFIHTYLWNTFSNVISGQKCETVLTPDSPTAEVSFDQVLLLASGTTFEVRAITNLASGVILNITSQPVIAGSPIPPSITTPLLVTVSRFA